MFAKLLVASLLILMVRSSVAPENVHLQRIDKIFRLIFGQKPQDFVAPLNESWSKITGEQTTPNEFPWQAILLVRKKDNGNLNSVFCGGTLIADEWILTSASCLHVTAGQELTEMGIYLGVIDVPSENQKTYWGKENFLHPDWNVTTQAGNVALIKLSNTVEFTEYIRPICVASSSEPDYIGQTVTVAGINSASVVSGVSATGKFHKMTVPVVPNGECNFFYNNLVTDRMMCTGATGICNHDTGDPLTFQQPDGTYKQIGIVSFAPTGSLCQNSNVPSAYTRLSSYSSWIQNIMSLHSSSASSHNTPSFLFLLSFVSFSIHFI